REAAVRVRVLRTRREVDATLMHDDIERERLRNNPVTAAVAGKLEHRSPVADAARVVEQVTYGERIAVVGKLRDVFLHRIVQAQLSVQRQHDNRRRGELLGDGTRL